ncbi:MAG: endonuclease III domain-containing protein [Actinomycetota bacterium]
MRVSDTLASVLYSAVVCAEQPHDLRVDLLGDLLATTGANVGPFMPWHSSSNPFDWLLAEALLRRTTRTAAHKAFVSLTSEYADWEALAGASIDDIARHISWVGLGLQRSRQLLALAKTIINDRGGTVPEERDSLKSLPGVGDYIADAVRLYVFQQPAFPIDPNVQRVLRRVFGSPTSVGTRYNAPYADPLTVRVADRLCAQLSIPKLQLSHRGLLHVAWTACRPIPSCRNCPLVNLCEHASRSTNPGRSVTA